MTNTRKPTSEEVLAILVDEQRHAAQLDPEVEEDITLDFDSTIADWRYACDLVGWRSLGRALNKQWCMNLSDSDWYTLLEPEDERTLRTLCHKISCCSEVVDIPKAALLGGKCTHNRVFCALRSILISLGVPKRSIQPCTPLMPLLSRFGWKLLQPCIVLAPGALPKIAHTGLAHRVIALCLFASFITTLVLWAISSPMLVWSFYVLIICLVLELIPHQFTRGRLELPGIDTIGDLAGRIAESKDGEPTGKH